MSARSLIPSIGGMSSISNERMSYTGLVSSRDGTHPHGDGHRPLTLDEVTTLVNRLNSLPLPKDTEPRPAIPLPIIPQSKDITDLSHPGWNLVFLWLFIALPFSYLIAYTNSYFMIQIGYERAMRCSSGIYANKLIALGTNFVLVANWTIQLNSKARADRIHAEKADTEMYRQIEVRLLEIQEKADAMEIELQIRIEQGYEEKGDTAEETESVVYRRGISRRTRGGTILPDRRSHVWAGESDDEIDNSKDEEVAFRMSPAKICKKQQPDGSWSYVVG